MQTIKEKAQQRHTAQVSVDVAMQKHDVASVTGIGAEAQQAQLFDNGYRLVHHFLKNEVSRSAVTGSTVYWNWWVRQWAEMDAVFLHRQYHEHFANTTPEQFANIWRNYHSVENLLDPEGHTKSSITNAFYSVIDAINSHKPKKK